MHILITDFGSSKILNEPTNQGKDSFYLCTVICYEQIRFLLQSWRTVYACELKCSCVQMKI